MNYLADFQLATERNYDLFNKETDTQWDWDLEDGTLILRFEQSQSKLDWKQNFRFRKVPYKNMKKKFKVHKGFLEKYASIREEVIKVLKREDITSIKIIGYSQGAGLAVFAYEDAWFVRPDLRDAREGVVFGCPRVVGLRAPKERWKNFLRISNGNDIVTKIPFIWMFYKHVGQGKVIGKKRLPFILSVKDHYPNEYMGNLK